MRQIVSRCGSQIRTRAARFFVVFTRACVVANSGKRPHIVHCPHHFFAGGKDFADFIQRQHSLIYPVEVDDIGFYKFRMFGNGNAGIGNGNIEQVFARKAVAEKNSSAFPNEIPFVSGFTANLYHILIVRVFISHQHLHIFSVSLQRLH